jgi:hypothetical protein
VKDGAVTYDDKAPEANIRKAITASSPASARSQQHRKNSPRMNTD